jgi:hypothetical protein
MIPSRFCLTNTFPTENAKDGLNYYLHAYDLPSITDFRKVLEDIAQAGLNLNQHMSGRITERPVNMLGDLGWKKSVNAAEREVIDSFGYNYVGILYHWSPLILGSQISGSGSILESAMAVNDLLIHLDIINLKLSNEWAHGDLNYLQACLIYHVGNMCNDFLSRQRFLGVDGIKYWCNDSIIKIQFNGLYIGGEATLTMNMNTPDINTRNQLWSMSPVTFEYYKAACLLYPELKDTVYDKVVYYNGINDARD